MHVVIMLKFRKWKYERVWSTRDILRMYRMNRYIDPRCINMTKKHEYVAIISSD